MVDKNSIHLWSKRFGKDQFAVQNWESTGYQDLDIKSINVDKVIQAILKAREQSYSATSLPATTDIPAKQTAKKTLELAVRQGLWDLDCVLALELAKHIFNKNTTTAFNQNTKEALSRFLDEIKDLNPPSLTYNRSNQELIKHYIDDNVKISIYAGLTPMADFLFFKWLYCSIIIPWLKLKNDGKQNP